MNLLLQNVSSREVRAIKTLAITKDIPFQTLSLEDLEQGSNRVLYPNENLPIGSVEFVQAAMQRMGVKIPNLNCYPIALHKWLHREVNVASISSLDFSKPWFLKPTRTKLFNGFVLPSLNQRDDLDEHTTEQLAKVGQLSIREMVYCSRPVKFVFEARYYVVKGKVLGYGRYDPEGAYDAPAPALEEVVGMLDAYKDAPAGWALDVGVLDTGETALVEVNDGWALGFYFGTLTVENYLLLLETRWKELVST